MTTVAPAAARRRAVAAPSPEAPPVMSATEPLTSTAAAKIFGLFPRKGTIQPGSDADLVVYNPNHRGQISAQTQQMNLDYNSFEGFEIAGRPDVVTVRGKVAARDGKFVGEPGRGRLLKREPTHLQ